MLPTEVNYGSPERRTPTCDPPETANDGPCHERIWQSHRGAQARSFRLTAPEYVTFVMALLVLLNS